MFGRQPTISIFSKYTLHYSCSCNKEFPTLRSADVLKEVPDDPRKKNEEINQLIIILPLRLVIHIQVLQLCKAEKCCYYRLKGKIPRRVSYTSWSKKTWRLRHDLWKSSASSSKRDSPPGTDWSFFYRFARDPLGSAKSSQTMNRKENSEMMTTDCCIMRHTASSQYIIVPFFFASLSTTGYLLHAHPS